MTTTKTKAKIKGTYGTMYYVKDMAKAVEFYKSKLGLKPSYESADWTEFPLEGHALCLHPMGEKKDIPSNGCLIMHVDGIKDLVADLKTQGVKVGEPHEVHPGSWSAEFTDAAGNWLSFYEGPKNG